jgi:hypothetical protein
MSANGNANPHELLSKFRSRYINGDSLRHRLGERAGPIKQQLSNILQNVLQRGEQSVKKLDQFTQPFPDSLDKFTKIMNDLTAAKASGMEKNKAIRIFHESLNGCSCAKKRTASGRILTSHVCN